MRRVLSGLTAGLLALPVFVAAQEPTCRMCPGTYVPVSEIQAYVDRAVAYNLVDQQIRQVDIGKTNLAVGVVNRGKLERPGEVAEHDFVSEVYHVIEGSATLVLGPDLVGKERRPATLETVRLFNGPGNNAKSITNGVEYHLERGDVVIIPAGTGHQFTKIDDHIVYLMVRVDPDKVTPHKTESESKEYLSTKPGPRGGRGDLR
jgi:mannose-6-phosphate isomerase-like protein (cupin superfamily)